MDTLILVLVGAVLCGLAAVGHALRHAARRDGDILAAIAALSPKVDEPKVPQAVREVLRDPEFKQAMRMHGRDLLRQRLAAKAAKAVAEG